MLRKKVKEENEKLNRRIQENDKKEKAKDDIIGKRLDKASKKVSTIVDKSINKIDEFNLFICNGCNHTKTNEIKYQCSECENYFYCEECEEKYSDSHKHAFLKIRPEKKTKSRVGDKILTQIKETFNEVKEEFTKLTSLSIEDPTREELDEMKNIEKALAEIKEDVKNVFTNLFK